MARFSYKPRDQGGSRGGHHEQSEEQSEQPKQEQSEQPKQEQFEVSSSKSNNNYQLTSSGPPSGPAGRNFNGHQQPRQSFFPRGRGQRKTDRGGGGRGANMRNGGGPHAQNAREPASSGNAWFGARSSYTRPQFSPQEGLRQMSNSTLNPGAMPFVQSAYENGKMGEAIAESAQEQQCQSSLELQSNSNNLSNYAPTGYNPSSYNGDFAVGNAYSSVPLPFPSNTLIYNGVIYVPWLSCPSSMPIPFYPPGNQINQMSSPAGYNFNNEVPNWTGPQPQQQMVSTGAPMWSDGTGGGDQVLQNMTSPPPPMMSTGSAGSSGFYNGSPDDVRGSEQTNAEQQPSYSAAVAAHSFSG